MKPPAREPPGASLILASASPRREALLKQAGILPSRIVAPDVDETPKERELPRDYALRLAIAKAEQTAKQYGDAFVLAADTVVALGRRILPKANTPQDVEHCLALLSGRRHIVLTAIAVKPPGQRTRTRIVATKVAFKVFSKTEITAYAESGEGLGKAGGYAIQGRAEALIRFINGSYSNIVGLPLYETIALLNGSGWRQ